MTRQKKHSVILAGAGLWLLSVLWTLTLLCLPPTTLPLKSLGWGGLGLLWLFNAVLWRCLWHEQAAISKSHNNWRLLAEHDALTGLINRRGFMPVAEAAANTAPCCVLVLDIDNFKRINDQYGHQQGDKVLQYFADCLQQTIRRNDIVCRWGGDEFVILLRDADEHAGKAFIRRIQQQTALPQDNLPRIRISAGIATLRTGESIAAKIKSADWRMLAAKSAPEKQR